MLTTATTFHALGQPTRLGIVDLLARSRPLSSSSIAASFDATASAISQHLKVLRESGLLTAETRGSHRIYRLDPAAMREAAGWIDLRTRMWESQLDSLAAYLKDMSP